MTSPRRATTGADRAQSIALPVGFDDLEQRWRRRWGTGTPSEAEDQAALVLTGPGWLTGTQARSFEG